jgi:hypothetical protein
MPLSETSFSNPRRNSTNQSAGTLVPKLHQKPQPQPFEETLLGEGQFSLSKSADGVVLALEIDLGLHLVVLGVGEVVFGIVAGGVEFLGHEPGLLGTALGEEPAGGVGEPEGAD